MRGNAMRARLRQLVHLGGSGALGLPPAGPPSYQASVACSRLCVGREDGRPPAVVVAATSRWCTATALGNVVGWEEKGAIVFA